jgi:prolyl-tRNA synthetase
MGSYGIGLERCMAAVVEQHHDENGIIWPVEIAPFRLEIVPISLKDEAQVALAEKLYQFCLDNKYDVLLDDRNERPGVKFKDAELIGIPYRITVGRGVKNGMVEFVERATGEKKDVSIDEVFDLVKKIYQ